MPRTSTRKKRSTLPDFASAARRTGSFAASCATRPTTPPPLGSSARATTGLASTPGNESPGTVADDGINDLLTAFWISKKGHHGKHHFSPGLAAQFPTASSDVLGSGKWSLGPSFDYEYESGRWFAGAIALQVWSVAGESDRKDVNMLMIKPFAYYSLSEEWDLMYVPYGIQVYWNKPSGEKVYLPIGGGAQRHFQVGSAQMNLGLAYYYNVVRPTKGTVSDLRFLVEFNF